MILVPTVPAFAAYLRVERLVSTVVLGLGLALIASALLCTLDPRTLDSGESVWLKPIRFCLAFGVHLLTMLWIGRLSTACRRADAAFALGLWLQAVTVIVEMACIVLQAVRGVHSHFNYATPFDRGVFTVMGLGTAVTLLGLALCARGLFHPSEDRLTMRLLVGAMGLAVLGGLIGVLMVMPTPEQRAMLDAGLRPVWIGGVGVGRYDFHANQGMQRNVHPLVSDHDDLHAVALGDPVRFLFDGTAIAVNEETHVADRRS
jgi:hypothetical protein